MNYSRYFETIGIPQLKNENQVFDRIVRDDSLSWEEITDVLKHIKEYSPFTGDYPKAFYDKNMLSILENMGMDYNYLDSKGNTFLQFIYQTNDEAFQFSPVRQYIQSKTKDIYNINKQGRHLLFNFLSGSKVGIGGEHFFSLLKQYPDFDLHKFDNSGHNLINHALLQEAPEEITQFLIDQNLSITHIDNNQSNLLNYFCFVSYTEKNISLFKKLVQVNDLSHKNKWDTSCLTSRIESSLQETNPFNFNSHKNWVILFLETIKNKELMYDTTICKNLHETLKSLKFVAEKALTGRFLDNGNYQILELYNESMAQVYFDYMNNIVSHKEEKIKRTKI